MVTRTHISVLDAIIAAHFMADAAQVERLAALVVEGTNADGTYLKVVLKHMQAQLGKPTRRARRTGAEVEAAEHVLDAIHAELYAAVMKGVGPDDLPMPERNRRATFARSAASTIRYFIRGGGDVRNVDVPTATKAGLRKAVQPETPAPADETRDQRSFRKAQDALVKSAQRLVARGDPDAAQRIEAAMDALEALLEALPEEQQPAQAAQDFGGQTTTIVGRIPPPGRSTPAERPMLHRGA